jgi:hypothetical protein
MHVNVQDDYGVPEDQIFGIRYGLRGFLDRHAKPVQLSRSKVDGIQLKGGTVLVGGLQRRAGREGRGGPLGITAQNNEGISNRLVRSLEATRVPPPNSDAQCA